MISGIHTRTTHHALPALVFDGHRTRSFLDLRGMSCFYVLRTLPALAIQMQTCILARCCCPMHEPLSPLWVGCSAELSLLLSLHCNHYSMPLQYTMVPHPCSVCLHISLSVCRMGARMRMAPATARLIPTAQGATRPTRRAGCGRTPPAAASVSAARCLGSVAPVTPTA